MHATGAHKCIKKDETCPTNTSFLASVDRTAICRWRCQVSVVCPIGLLPWFLTSVYNNVAHVRRHDKNGMKMNYSTGDISQRSSPFAARNDPAKSLRQNRWKTRIFSSRTETSLLIHVCTHLVVLTLGLARLTTTHTPMNMPKHGPAISLQQQQR